MGNRLIGLFVYKVYRMKILSHTSLREMRYGMEVLLNELAKVLILLALFEILDKLSYFLFSLLILVTIRCSSGGLHFHEKSSCLLFSTAFFFAAAYAQNYLPIGLLHYRYLLITLSIALIWAFSPVASANRPIKNRRKQLILKYTAVISTIFWSCILLFQIQNAGFMSCGITTITLQAFQLVVGYITDPSKKQVRRRYQTAKVCQKISRWSWVENNDRAVVKQFYMFIR
ncbi:MAG: accessory gene regulator ArgB-like protein [Caulobacteraceae bacterium]